MAVKDKGNGYYRYTGAPFLAPGMPACDLTPEDYTAELARLPAELQPVAAALYTYLKSGTTTLLSAPDDAPPAVAAAPVDAPAAPDDATPPEAATEPAPVEESTP
jgi:hypothetical protein